MDFRMTSAVARYLLPLAFLAAPGPAAAAEECVCRLDGAKIEVSNFPQTQKVKLESLSEPIDVRQVETRKIQTFELDLSTGEKEPLGPIPLAEWRLARIQISQISPKTAAATPVTVHWYIRNHPDDAFFDPCRREPSLAHCTNGLPPEGAKLTPLLPSLSGPTGSERLEGFTILNAPVSIAPIDIVGAEALMVIENASAAPRSLRIHLTLEK
jgi:hypothetical protein